MMSIQFCCNYFSRHSVFLFIPFHRLLSWQKEGNIRNITQEKKMMWLYNGFDSFLNILSSLTLPRHRLLHQCYILGVYYTTEGTDEKTKKEVDVHIICIFIHLFKYIFHIFIIFFSLLSGSIGFSSALIITDS